MYAGTIFQNRLISSLLVLAALSFLLVACGTGSAKEKITEGEKALDFTLSDLKGRNVSLGGFSKEKALLLDFTTTWCPHCITIIPTIKNIYSSYKAKGLEVVAIYINESKSKIEKFAKKHKIPYTVLLDTGGSVASRYGIRGIPTIIVVDKDGIIRYRGHHIPREVIEKVVKE